VDESLAFFAAMHDGRAAVDDRERFLSADLRLDITSRLSACARRARVSLPRSPGVDALWRRSAACAPGRRTQVGPDRHHVCTRRAHGRLHARDTSRLLAWSAAARCRQHVVVVEHDVDVIAAADYVIEIGPGAGPDGGARHRNRDAGGPGVERRLQNGPASPGAAGAAERARGGCFHRLQRARRGGSQPQGLDVEVPAGGLVVVTGVSGSGKSSLVFDVIASGLERMLRAGVASALHAPDGNALILRGPRGRGCRRAATVSPSPWSHTAALVGCFDAIPRGVCRLAGSESPRPAQAGLRRIRPGGRCDACEGRGQTRVSMDFLRTCG